MNEEIEDVGRAIDRPKGFVKWSLIAYWSAILSMAGFMGVLIRMNIKATNECGEKVESVMQSTQQTIDAIRVEYNNKLEARLNRLEHVEQRVDSLPQKRER